MLCTGAPAAPGATLKLPVRHVVTEELQAYYKRVMAVLDSGWRGDGDAGKAARRLLASVLASMAADPGALKHTECCLNRNTCLD